MGRAVLDNKLMSVKIFLEYDPNLAYIKHEPTGQTPFISAVSNGFVLIAKEIMNTCPDSVYTPSNVGDNALHFAIFQEKPDLVDYILSTPSFIGLLTKQTTMATFPYILLLTSATRSS